MNHGITILYDDNEIQFIKVDFISVYEFSNISNVKS